MEDKIIRIGVDSSKAIQESIKMRSFFEDMQASLNQAAKDQRSLSKDEIDDMKSKISFLREQGALEEERLRSKIQNRLLDIQYAEKDLALWKARRLLDQGSDKRQSNQEPNQDEKKARASIAEDKLDLLKHRVEYSETKELHKKQLRELDEISDILSKEKKSEEVTSQGGIFHFFKKIFNGKSEGSDQVDLRQLSNKDRDRDNLGRDTASVIQGTTSGSLSGIVGAGGKIFGVSAGTAAVAAAVAAVVSGALKSVNSYQENLRHFAVSTQTPLAIAETLPSRWRDPSLGMTGIEVLNKLSTFIPAKGDYVGYDENRGLMGAQVSRGFSDTQIQQLLSVSRFSGRSVLGTTSDFERYSREKDKSLIRLPEILETYLKATNEILNRTGRVDAIGVQRSVMSVGKSYGVSGTQLESTLSGLQTLSSLSDNPVLMTLQRQAFSELYPEKGPWDLVKMLQNPLENPDFMKKVLSKVSGFGGGGLYTQLGMANLGVDPYTIDRLMSNELKIEKRPNVVSEKSLNQKNYDNGRDFVGAVSVMGTELGSALDKLNEWLSSLTNGTAAVFGAGGKLETTVANGTEKGVDRALKKNQR